MPPSSSHPLAPRQVTSNPHGLLKGTLLQTPSGPKAIEDLQIGEVLIDSQGQLCSLTKMHIEVLANVEESALHLPVCVQKDALGPGLPERDLYLAPDHGVLIEDVLATASAIANGRTIRFTEPKDFPEGCVFYSYETQSGVYLCAEGLPVEPRLPTRPWPLVLRLRIASRRQLPLWLLRRLADLD